MPTITKADARSICNNYINFGKIDHFKSNGKAIKGFLFKRKDLFKLLDSQTVYLNNYLFLMLGLNENEKAELILGAISEAFNMVNLSTLIKSDDLYTDTINVENANNILGGNKTIIDKEELKAMMKLYSDRLLTTPPNSNDYLTTSLGLKVKGYHLNRQNLVNLGLLTPINSINENDEFIFMPVIRNKRYEGPFHRPHLSIAISQFYRAQKETDDTIIEYCLPCPSACPTNYPIQ